MPELLTVFQLMQWGQSVVKYVISFLTTHFEHNDNIVFFSIAVFAHFYVHLLASSLVTMFRKSGAKKGDTFSICRKEQNEL